MERRSDEDLLAASASTPRDDGAFRELVTRYARMVYQAAARQVSDAHRAEDVAQAVFLVLARRARTIRDARLLPAWLLKTTHYCATNARLADARRRRHEQQAAMNSTRHDDATSPPDPDLGPILDAALMRLAERDRAMVALHYFDGRDLGEIASAFDTTADAVRKRMARALARLREVLSAKGPLLSATAVGELLLRAAATAPPGYLTEALLAHLAAPTSGAAAISKGAITMMKLTQLKWGVAAAMATSALAAVVTIGVVMADSRPASSGAASAATPTSSTTRVEATTAPTTTASAATSALVTAASETCQGRLRDLVQAAMQYSYERKGRMPAGLGVVWNGLPASRNGLNRAVARRYFCPDDEVAHPIPAKVTPQWLDANSSFIYLAGNLPNSISGQKDLVIAHEKFPAAGDGAAAAPHGDRITVAFANGVVGTLPRGEAEPLIKKSIERLAAFKPLKRYQGEPAD